MNKIIQLTLLLSQAKAGVLLLGLLLLINEQAFAQKAPLVIVNTENFERPQFSDDFILPLPATDPGFNFWDFSYATAATLSDGKCIITKNAIHNGTWGGDIGDNTTGTGYYLYAAKPQNVGPMIVYSVDVEVAKGEIVELGMHYCAFNNGYNIEIQATGTGLGNETKSSGNLASSDTAWKSYSLSVTATQNGTITFNIVDKWGWYESEENPYPYHSFGIDDITIKRSALKITSPASLDTYTTVGKSVLLQAQYNYPSQSAIYQWEKSEDGTNWSTVSGTQSTTSSTSFTTADFYPTETEEKYVYYRLAFSYDNFGSVAFYSDVITIDFRSDEYLFKEDFGGNTISTNQPNPSGDWWIMPGYQPAITTDLRYGGIWDWDKIRDAYGQNLTHVSSDGEYAITKLSGSNPIPGYTGESWSYGGECCYDDHTFPGNNSKGYFMNALIEGKQYKTVYAASIPVTPEMKGQNFIFSAWQVAMWGINDTYPTPFRLTVEDNTGGVISSKDFAVKNSWGKSELPFNIPGNYSGSTLTIRVSAIGQDLRLGLDDITLTPFSATVRITSPTTGSSIESVQAEFKAEYNIATSSIYKWQYSTTGNTGTWEDISGSEGTINNLTGAITYTVCPLSSGFYHLAIASSTDTDYNNAIYSNTVRLTREGNYFFKEDFGGNTPSTSISGDWWITKTKALDDELQNRYGSGFAYSDDNEWTIPSEYSGMSTTLGMYDQRFAITKVSSPLNMGSTPKAVSDHTSESDDSMGYFMAIRPQDAAVGTVLYSSTVNCVPSGSSLVFSAWFINLDNNTDVKNILLKVEGSDGFGTAISQNITIVAKDDWTQYSVPFKIPDNYSGPVTISIINNGAQGWPSIFGLDDILLDYNPPVKITYPDASEITILEGTSLDLKGAYTYMPDLGSGSLTYQWETSSTGQEPWTSVDSGTHPANTNFTMEYPTGAIDATLYYRLTVTGNSKTEVSEILKITPYSIEALSKTYWVCPDNMTDDEAKYASRAPNPGMLDDDPEKSEPGYLPSLISMEVMELYNVHYKWYDENGNLLENVDMYEAYQKDVPQQRPRFSSDGKEHTLSVQNERNTEGIFVDRTYWVELYDSQNRAIPDIDKIPIYVKQSYICASLEPKVSPATARRLHRGDFGGTAADAPKVSQTGLSNVDFELYTKDDDNLPEGEYMLTKLTPTLKDNWYAMKDHIYEGIANEKYGYSMTVNASDLPARFYTYEMTNLGSCSNIGLVFSGWFASPVAWNGYEKANLKLKLTDSDTGKVLAEFLTGNLIDKEGKWRQFGFQFHLPDDVYNLTLEVLNNNFGTTGGNDVVLDDIEIYLAMPPVTLVPSMDSYVCPDNTEVTLKGSYEDDGTLGNRLDYRWEYKKTENDTWRLLSGANASGSVTNGFVSPSVSEYFIGTFTGNDNGYYRLIVGQSKAFSGSINYDCVALSEPRYLQLAEGENSKTPAPAMSGLTAVCYNDETLTVTNTDTELQNYKSYTWLLNGTIIEESGEDYTGTTDLSITLPLSGLEPGYHTLTLNASNIGNCSSYAIHEFLIYPETTTWIAQGTEKNWNDKRNWSDGVPGECTDVIIPNQSMDIDNGVVLSDHYPALITPTVETLNGNVYQENQENLNKQQQGQNEEGVFSLRPACDTISFKMGGSVARTDYLKYRFAKVDLDIKPNRWYTVSAPLRAMYSGDYFIEGNVKRQNPTVFMMKYNATNPQTADVPAKEAGDFSNPFNTLSEDLHPGLGYAVFVDDGNKTVAELQPFRFPKDSTEYAMWNYHGDYFGQSAMLNRDNIGRFTYEEVFTGTLPETSSLPASFNVSIAEDKAAYSTMLIGNPFMSHLSFSKFAAANASQLNDEGYYIWTSGDTYDAYMPGIFPEDPDEIAPMQSFIMKKKGQAKVSSLAFSFDMSIAAPLPSSEGATLRSSAARSGNAALRLDVLRNDVSQSNIRLKYDPAEKNKYNARKDMWTLFSTDKTNPAVLYALLEGKAASIRTLGDLSESVELGIRTDEKGKLTLRLSGMETLDADYGISLEDRLIGDVYDLRNNPEYTFDNQTGNVQGRFFLKIGNRDSEEDLPETAIRIFTDNKQIVVTSSAEDPIESVKIYSLQGQLLTEKQAAGHSYFAMDSPVQNHIVIVSVTTKKGNQKRTKLLIN